MFRRSKKRI